MGGEVRRQRVMRKVSGVERISRATSRKKMKKREKILGKGAGHGGERRARVRVGVVRAIVARASGVGCARRGTKRRRGVERATESKNTIST